MDLQGTGAWKFLVTASIVLLVAVIIADLFLMDWFSAYIATQQLEYLTLVFTFVLIADIYMSFVKADDKKAFLKKNALKILILLPWGTFFRVLSFLRLEGTVAEIPLFADLFVVQKAGSAAEKTIMIAEKAKRVTEL